jgi:hypothetical protein
VVAYREATGCPFFSPSNAEAILLLPLLRMSFFGVCPQKPQTKRRCNCWKAAWSAPLIDGDAAVESIQLEPILTFMKRGLTLRHWCARLRGVQVRVMVDGIDRTAAP